MKKVFICMFAIISFICACTETEMWNEKMKSTNTSDDMTIEAVKKSAMDFINGLKPITRGESFDIASVYAWRSADAFSTSRVNGEEELPDTALYIVNFTNNKGFILLSAVDPAHEVVAFVEEGNMTPNTTIDNPGFKIFLEGLKEHITRFDPVGPGLPDTTLITFDSLLVGNDPENPYNGTWVIDSIVPALMTTKWGQHYPYNIYCFTNTGEQAVAGCVAIAAAQVMAYHQQPSSYNGHTYYWNYILEAPAPYSSLGIESTARLVNDVGVLANTNYGVNVSGSSANQLVNCWNNMGYTFNTFTYYNYNSYREEILQGRPIIIEGWNTKGYGHCWVIDGFILRTLHEHILGQDVIRIRQRLVHCNWGWDGVLNGYFLYNAFIPANRKLTDNLNNSTPSNTPNLLPIDSAEYKLGLKAYYGLEPE